MERKKSSTINNAFYEELDEMWQSSNDHPIALLRAENAVRNPWILETLAKNLPLPCKVLDIGCGGGLLTNFLAEEGYEVSGIDLSENSLEMGKKYDKTGTVDYRLASAYELPYPDATFDAVCAMDLLEHVEKPEQVISEASRVLKKGGLFFFHTFNRNLLSYFIIIKGVEWCFSNAPTNMHVYPLFIKPEELTQFCKTHSLKVEQIRGFRPDFSKGSFWKMVFRRKVDENFRFIFTRSLKTGYCGYSVKF